MHGSLLNFPNWIRVLFGSFKNNAQCHLPIFLPIPNLLGLKTWFWDEFVKKDTKYLHIHKFTSLRGDRLDLDFAVIFFKRLTINTPIFLFNLHHPSAFVNNLSSLCFYCITKVLRPIIRFRKLY